MLLIGPPPSSSSQTRVVANVPKLLGQLTTALPVGQHALLLLGGKIGGDSVGEKAANEFPEERIVIPVGVNPQNLKNFTLYDLLGFTPEWADSADSEAIKKAYHKAVLAYHPDKAQFRTADGKEDRTVFLKIQEAFNTLSNESKRRAYDSQLPFDESIPTEEKVEKALAKGPHKYFKLFDPVFKRNARFAVKKPVPELGDSETPMAQVYRFYDYWIKFESWRDFTGIGAEYNPDQAGSREEKRYMQKENEKLAKKLKKREMDRIIELVMLSERKDPRIAADKASKKAAKDADKNAREANLRRKEEDEAAAKAWHEAQEAAADARKGMSKAEKEKLKKLQSNARNILRKLFRASATQGNGEGEYGILSAADVELLCAGADLDDLNIMVSALGGAPASKDASLFLIGGAEEVYPRLEVIKERQGQAAEDERIVKEVKKREAEESARSSKKSGGAAKAYDVPPPREWSADELSALAKSVVRYPAGFANRWYMVSAYLNDLIKPAEMYTPDDVMVAAHQAAVAAGTAGGAAVATADA